MSESWIIAILFFSGIGVGFINTVAGGGSLITLPILIFLGIDSTIANGTNRIAILIQNIVAIGGYRSKGVADFRYSTQLAIFATLGSVFGTLMAVHMDPKPFEKALALSMLVISALIIIRPEQYLKRTQEDLSTSKKAWASVCFFIIGIYGGFIQAGTAIFMMSALSIIHGMSLVKINGIKVFVVAAFTIISLGIFVYYDQVLWKEGLVMGMGNAIGGWFGSRWSVDKGDVWIRRVLMMMIVVMAIKLWIDA